MSGPSCLQQSIQNTSAQLPTHDSRHRWAISIIESSIAPPPEVPPDRVPGIIVVILITPPSILFTVTERLPTVFHFPLPAGLHRLLSTRVMITNTNTCTGSPIRSWPPCCIASGCSPVNVEKREFFGWKLLIEKNSFRTNSMIRRPRENVTWDNQIIFFCPPSVQKQPIITVCKM